MHFGSIPGSRIRGESSHGVRGDIVTCVRCGRERRIKTTTDKATRALCVECKRVLNHDELAYWMGEQDEAV